MSTDLEMQRLRHERIKYELRIRKLTFASLSERESVHHSLLAGVSSSKKRSEKAARILASAIDTTPEELWPEIYGGNDE
ncbi:helix-turn-helix domain-containing protein [Halovulum sp. GXIMD14793]